MTRILVNGRAGGTVDPLDRGLHYGDGLFETIAIVGGRPRFIDWHFERLVGGARALGFPAPDLDALRADIAAVATEPRCVVKLVLTRGAGERGYRPPRDPQPTRIVAAAPWPAGPRDAASAGIRLGWCRTRLARNGALAGHKHLNRLEQVLARAEWDDGAMDEGLMQDDRGRVIAATQANLFARIDGAWCTPRLDECGVAGVMRRAFQPMVRRTGDAGRGTPARSRGRRSGDLPLPDERADRRLAGRHARRPRRSRSIPRPWRSTPGSRVSEPVAAVRRRLLRSLAIAGFLGWNHYERQWLREPIAGLVEPTVFEVPRGASLTSVARRLEEAGLMERPGTWLRHAKRERLTTRLKAGEYRLQPGTSPAMLLDQFVAGDVILHALTLPEGWTFRQALAAIQSHPQVTAELKGLDDAAILARLGLRDAHAGRPVLSGHVSIPARHDRPRTPAPGPCAPRDRAGRGMVASRRRTCRTTRHTRRSSWPRSSKRRRALRTSGRSSRACS